MIRSLKVAALLAFTSVTKGNFRIALLTMLILILVTLNLLFVPGLLDGLAWGANDKLVNTYSGNLLIESNEANPQIENASRLMSEIAQMKGVEAVTSRSNLGAEIDCGSEHLETVVSGIQPDADKAVFTIDSYLIEGSYLSPDDTGMILLGVQLAGADRPNLELYARSLRSVHAGDKVSVTYANGVRKEYTVKGIFYTEFIQTDWQAFVSQKEFDSVAPTLANNATTINIKTTKSADTDDIIRQIENMAGGLKVMTWEDYAGIVHSMTASFGIIEVIMDTVNLLVAGITIFIVTYIDVANRKRQIGIQRAIGITPASITLSYLIRALFYALIATALAILIYVYGVIPLEAHFPFHFPFGNVYLRVMPSVMARTALTLFGVSILSALIPVYSVMRVKIIDAIWS
jgi:putative ABC transport system permease protein